MESYLSFESTLMRSIVNEICPGGIPTDAMGNHLNEEEKKQLYLSQRKIIQEFQKRADKEVIHFNSVLSTLNERLLFLRKKASTNNSDSGIAPNKFKDPPSPRRKGVRPPPTQTASSPRSPRFQQQNFSISLPSKPAQSKSRKPPFRR